jgi:hypothetical protein
VERQNVAFNGGRIGPRRAGVEYAVYRQLDGCAVPTPVGYHPRYLQPGAADNPPPPVTREGEPSSKR